MKMRFAIALLACMACKLFGVEVKLPTRVLDAPLFGRNEYIRFDIDVSGAKGSEVNPNGGNGGLVEIHLSDPSADLDDKDFLIAPVLKGQQITLDSQSDSFRCRGADKHTTITVSGNATIECKGVFSAQIKGDFSRGPVSVTVIINGKADEVLHELNANLSPGDDAVHRDGGHLVVKTSAVGSMGAASYIHAKGGSARGHPPGSVESTRGGMGGQIWVAGPCAEMFHGNVSGGHGAIGGANVDTGSDGGDAGSISIHAQLFSCGVLYAMGGNGGGGSYRMTPDSQTLFSTAGDGGKGGHICMLAESLYDGVCALVSGGEGGNKNGPPWRAAGSGGGGGTIYLEASQWWDSNRKGISLIGDGGNAGNPHQGPHIQYAQALASVGQGAWSLPGSSGGHGGTISVIHKKQTLHEYPKKVYRELLGHPVEKRQEESFGSVPLPMRPPYGHRGHPPEPDPQLSMLGPRRSLFGTPKRPDVAASAAGGNGGAGNAGVSFEREEERSQGSQGGNGGAGGVVYLPEDWVVPLSKFIRTEGGAGGHGGAGAYGRNGTRETTSGGDALPGGKGGDGGEAGRVNGQSFGTAGDGGNGGEGGVGGRGFISGKHSAGRGGDGGQGGNSGDKAASPGQGGKGGWGGSSSSTDEHLRGQDGQPGGIGGPAPQEQEAWAEVMPFNTAAAIALDYNRDGEISFGPDDRPAKDKPFIFWINDDKEILSKIVEWTSPTTYFSVEEEDDDDKRTETDLDAYIPGIDHNRDLEDFIRLWVDAGHGSGTENVEYRIHLEALENEPAFNLFLAEAPDGGNDYLYDEDAAKRQRSGEHGKEFSRLSSGRLSSKTLPFKDPRIVSERKSWHLLLEGTRPGKGALTVETLKAGEVVARSEPVYVELMKVSEMYDTWSAGHSEDWNVMEGIDGRVWPKEAPVHTAAAIKLSAEENAKLPCILFVHGWRMTKLHKSDFTNTMFKRLWHLGYKGRFATFYWPTFYTPSPASRSNWQNFDASEERAWNSGRLLTGIIKQLSTQHQGKLMVYAHSMGNIVVGEALRQLGRHDQSVACYVAAQAAIAGHAWDNSLRIIRPQTSSFRPNLIAHYWQQGASSPPHEWEKERRPPYFDPSVMPRFTRYVNHYNEKDFALWTWQFDQLKKTFRLNHGYSILRGSFYTNLEDLDLPGDHYRIFSYITPGQSNALGQTGLARGGSFSTSQSVDLDQEFQFGDLSIGHSAQFLSTLQKRWRYWKRVMEDMQLGEMVSGVPESSPVIQP